MYSNSHRHRHHRGGGVSDQTHLLRLTYHCCRSPTQEADGVVAHKEGFLELVGPLSSHSCRLLFCQVPLVPHSHLSKLQASAISVVCGARILILWVSFGGLSDDLGVIKFLAVYVKGEVCQSWCGF